jgi:hypothetical protein
MCNSYTKGKTNYSTDSKRVRYGSVPQTRCGGNSLATYEKLFDISASRPRPSVSGIRSAGINRQEAVKERIPGGRIGKSAYDGISSRTEEICLNVAIRCVYEDIIPPKLKIISVLHFGNRIAVEVSGYWDFSEKTNLKEDVNYETTHVTLDVACVPVYDDVGFCDHVHLRWIVGG